MLNHLKSFAMAVLALGIIAAAYGQSEEQPKTNDTVEKSLIEMERQWAEVCATRDTSVLERILSDDFLGTNTEGELYTKSEDIEKIAKKPKGEYLSGRLDRVKVRFFGDDVAVLHGVETCIRKTKDGKEGPETSTVKTEWALANRCSTRCDLPIAAPDADIRECGVKAGESPARAKLSA